MKPIFYFSLLLASLYVKGQALSPTEKKIVEQVKSDQKASLDLLKELVNINSGTLNIEGVRKVGSVLRKEFEKIGFSTEWIYLPDSLKRAGHLVAYKKGGKGKKLFLIGHLDTVFEPDQPSNPYQLLNDSTVTGQGVNDMKGGDVMILSVLRSLHRLGLLEDVTITVYLTGDEEKTGKPDSVSRGDFINRARQHDIALGFETAQGMNTVVTARRGSGNWQLKVFAEQGHSAAVFTRGYGSIYETARILEQFRKRLAGQPFLTFNPGMIAGGSETQYDSSNISAQITGKTNIISPFTVVQGDLRYLREKQKDSARMLMKQIVNSGNLLGTRAEISFSDGIPSMEPTSGNNKLVTLLDAINRALGFGPVAAGDPGSRGAADISYVAKYLDCIDGLGVSGRGAHAPGELMGLSTFPKLAQRTAILIYRLTR